MATFQNTVTIARPADEVFAFLADFGNIPAWNYAIARTVQTSPGQAGVGATYRQTRTIPRSRDESFEVTDFAPSSRLAVRGQIGPFNARLLASDRSARRRWWTRTSRHKTTGVGASLPLDRPSVELSRVGVRH